MTGTFGEELGRPTKSFALTSRVKTAPTLRDKLQRGSALSSIQDVVGVRVVGDISLTEQDELTSRSTRLFPEHRVVDRRMSPMHGYRAVHVIAKVDGFPVEIQIRTVWQHVWAEATEKLADAWGRGIRYGLPPIGDDEPEIAERSHAVERWKQVSMTIADIEREMEKLHGVLAERVMRSLLSDPFGDPKALADHYLSVDPELMAATTEAIGRLRSTLETGGLALSALLLGTMEDVRRSLQSPE